MKKNLNIIIVGAQKVYFLLEKDAFCDILRRFFGVIVWRNDFCAYLCNPKNKKAVVAEW